MASDGYIRRGAVKNRRRKSALLAARTCERRGRAPVAGAVFICILRGRRAPRSLAPGRDAALLPAAGDASSCRASKLPMMRDVLRIWRKTEQALVVPAGRIDSCRQLFAQKTITL